MYRIKIFIVFTVVIWAGCKATVSGPAPVVHSVTPALACTQGSTWVTLQGSGFSPMLEDALGDDPGVALPEILLIPATGLDGAANVGEAVPLPQFDSNGQARVRWENTGSLSVLLDASLLLAPGVYDVEVRNPNGKKYLFEKAIAIVGAPVLLSAAPTPICTAQYENEIVLEGSFLQVGDVLPEVHIGDVVITPTSMEDCTALVIPVENVLSCSRMVVSVAEDLLPVGAHSVTVINPAPAACSSENVQLLVVPPPSVENIEPEPVCLEQSDRSFIITGSDFLVIDGVPPTANIGTAEATTQPQACQPLEEAPNVEVCNELLVTLIAGELEPGEHPVVVQNPYGAGCLSEQDVTLLLVPAPEITAIEPNPACTAQNDIEIEIQGQGFLVIDGNLPDVRIQGAAPADIWVDEGSCEPLPGVSASSCSRIFVLIAHETITTPGMYDVVVYNPEPTGCSDTFPLEIVPPPDVVSITPETICSGGGLFTISGTNLHNVSAYLEDPDGGIVPAQSVSVNPEGTEAIVAFPSGLRPTVYDLHVTGVSGCADMLTAAVSVNLGPVVYYLDPPAVYNGVPIRATLYGSGFTQTPVGVSVAPSGGGVQTALSDVVWNPASPTRIQATIPAGLSAGVYDVFVYNSGGCDAFLPAALTVVSETVVALQNPPMIPGFGLQGSDTAVNILAKIDAELLSGEVNFTATPRAYLFNADSQVAMPLRAVMFESSSQLSAVVPPVPAGIYDLIVVNPDNTVGFAAGAYQAVSVAPPVIENALPNKINKEAGQTLVIYGQNFYNPEVVLECEDGSLPPVVVNTLQSDASHITVTVDASLVYNGAVCVVRVTNTANGTWDEYFSVAVTTPAGNISPFRPDYLATPEKVAHLNMPRRAPGVSFGRATQKARFLWAVGGDQGAADSALATVETASIGRFGEIGAWRLLNSALPSARTGAHARVLGSFIYLLGGQDAAGTVRNEIWRARILDPLNVVQVEDVALRFAPSGSGLTAGAWTYVISAIMPASDAENPGGEILPSEPVTLYAPDVPDGIEVQLTWNTVFGADGATPAATYRIYRTTGPNMSRDDLRLLAEIPGTANPTHTFVDTNPATFADPNRKPLSTGELGIWHLAGQLNTPRAHYGFVEVSEYSASGQATSCIPFWYVLGGMTNTSTESATYEVFNISGSQLGTPVQFAAAGDLPARREHALWAATQGNSTALQLQECEFYLYSGSGASGPQSSPTVVNSVRVAKYSLAAAGELGTFGQAMQSGNIVTYRAYGAFWSGDRAYNLGGYQAGVITSNVMDGRWTSLTEPRIQNFTSSGQNLNSSRAYYGYTRVGSVFYIVGGINSGGNVLDSSEYNVR